MTDEEQIELSKLIRPDKADSENRVLVVEVRLLVESGCYGKLFRIYSLLMELGELQADKNPLHQLLAGALTSAETGLVIRLTDKDATPEEAIALKQALSERAGLVQEGGG